MKKLLSVTAFTICALFSMNATAVEWPSWVLGTWAGQVLNYVPDEGKTYGFYKLTLTSTGGQDKFIWNDEEPDKHGSLQDWKITEQEDCHIVATCWYWSDTGDDKFDAKYVFCNPSVSCSHYTNQSTYYSEMGDGGDTLKANLAKLEMNTAPAEGWPEWVLGNWTGPYDIWIPDQNKTYYGYYVLALNSTTNQYKVIWDDGDPDRDGSLLGWKITEQKDCHVIATCWFWDEDEDRVYDMKYVFRNPDANCSDYDKSSAYIKERNILREHNDGKCETGNVSLTKDEGNIVPVDGWPKWALGTWKGNVVNVVPDDPNDPEVCNGTYALTLTSTGSKEHYELEGEDPIDVADDMFGWKITDSADCHIVATAWCWDDEKDDKFDAKYVLRNPDMNCSHYSNSTFHQEQRKDNDTVDCSNLVKYIKPEPTIAGDEGAKITGDAESGYVITPSEGAKEVKVTIPEGVDAAKVTVKVSPEAKVTPNGAAVRVVRGENDITGFLDMPKEVGGVIDLSAATVKEEYVKEPFNMEKGAKIDLSSTAEPSFTTAPTQKGLTYRLKEGRTLEEMKANTTGDSKLGDGEAWSPKITVSDGTSAFYTIEVTK